jgi:hypothetical protein
MDETTQEIKGLVGQDQTRTMTPLDCEIAVMGKEGDVKTIWNPHNHDEVENARRTFTDMRAKGYLAFRVTAKGDQGEQMNEFDATAGKVVMVPPFQGG